jgi:hypothetical protein
MWLPELVKNRTAMQAMMGMKKIGLVESKPAPFKDRKGAAPKKNCRSQKR